MTKRETESKPTSMRIPPDIQACFEVAKKKWGRSRPAEMWFALRAYYRSIGIMKKEEE